jgi:U4/U6.U5 tri-snRNP component SNU23
MSEPKKSAYGGNATGGDVSFRRTWDRAEYAERAAKREVKEREEAKARYEAKLLGKKWHRRASTPPDAHDTTARAARLDLSSMVGKTKLVSTVRDAGFYCAACDRTFKDNLTLVEHFNSKQHQLAVGETGEVKKASAEEVKARLSWLKRKIEEDAKDEAVDLGERLKLVTERDEKEREEKRQKRREKRRKTKDGVGVLQAKFEDDGIIC